MERKYIIALIIGAPVSLLLVAFIAGFISNYVLQLAGADFCPDEPRGFDEGQVIVREFENQNSDLELELWNRGIDEATVKSITFTFMEESIGIEEGHSIEWDEEEVEVNEHMSSGSKTNLTVTDFEGVENCNDIPVEISYESNGLQTSIGSISAPLEN